MATTAPAIPLGRAGDFVTAPEISQIFGELIGLWAASVWIAMGRPAGTILAELGPGRGTLMADALRAIRAAAPDAAFALNLVETSPVLKARQAASLGAFRPTWHESPETLPDGPAIVIANEFFDCLPVRQFERTARGWCERLVGLSETGCLTFGLAPEPQRDMAVDGPVGLVATIPGPALDLARGLARRLTAQGGALLAIDYGHARPGFGDTLQALSGHAFVDPLAAPGEADLTVHVDFAALAQAAGTEGAVVNGPVDQRDFLLGLGLTLRAERLKRSASPSQALAIDAAVARLTDTRRGGMGTLFKAMALASPGLGPLPGF